MFCDSIFLLFICESFFFLFFSQVIINQSICQNYRSFARIVLGKYQLDLV